MDEIKELFCPDDIIMEKKGEEYLIIERKTSNWMKTDKIGKDIIEACGKGKNKGIEALINSLSEKYKIPSKYIRESVMNFLEGARKTNLVRESRDCQQVEKKEDEDCLPRSLWIHLTNGCNLQCAYCYTDTISHKDNVSNLCIGIIKRIVQQDIDLGKTRIILTGGEPLLREDIIEVLKACEESRETTLLTNGTIEGKDLYKEIVQLADRIQVSLDGVSPGTNDRLRGKGSFNKVMKTIDLLRQLGFESVEVAFTPTRLNINELPKMLNFARSNGIKRLHVNQLVPIGRAKNHKEFFPCEDDYLNTISRFFRAYDELKEGRHRIGEKLDLEISVAGFQQPEQILCHSERNNCGLGEEIISIDFDGNAYPCPLFHVPEFLAGNVNATAFKKICMNAREKCRQIEIDNIRDCRDCDLKRFCRGGCRAGAYYVYGDFCAKDAFCLLKAERIKRTLWQTAGPVV